MNKSDKAHEDWFNNAPLDKRTDKDAWDAAIEWICKEFSILIKPKNRY